MNLRSLVPLTVSAALVLAAGRASAQPNPLPRARFNIGFEGGLFTVPAVVAAGVVGMEGRLGVQIKDWVAVDLVGDGGLMIGKLFGAHMDGALLVVFSPNDAVSIGFGPDVGRILAGTDRIIVGGTFIGGRLHLAWHLKGSWDESGSIGKGWTVGMDVRLVSSGDPDFIVPNGKRTKSFTHGGPFILWPMLTMSYQFF
jgi:hypothetical protein